MIVAIAVVAFASGLLMAQTPAAATAKSTSVAPPRATWVMTASSRGETSAKVSGEPTHSPPIQWLVETSTSSMTTCSDVAVNS